MAQPNKRKIDGFAYTEGATQEIKLPKGYLEQGLVFEGSYTHNPTTDGTAVREFPTFIERISVIGDGGRMLHDVRPRDLMREAMIYEQMPKTEMVSGPSTVTAAGGAKTGRFTFPLQFREPFADKGDAGELLALPSWMYDEITIRVTYGNRDSIVRGGTGTLSDVAFSVTAVGIQDDWSQLGDPRVWGAAFRRNLRSFRSVALDASAETERTIELPRTAPFRSIVVITEDADGEGADTLLNELTLELNNNIRQFSRVPYRTLRMENARVFGVSLPPGVAVIEFAEDADIGDGSIFEAQLLTAANLILNRAAVAGTLTLLYKRIEAFR